MGGVRVRNPGHVLAGDVAPLPVEVVEAVVFLVDDHDVLEMTERTVAGRGRGNRGGERQRQESEGRAERAEAANPVVHGTPPPGHER